MSQIQKALIQQYAKAAGEFLCEQTISTLENIKATLSADESGLENTWEEICVQVQGEESFFWETYQDTVFDIVISLIEQLPSRDRSALWLQTGEGWDWHWDREWEEEHAPRHARSRDVPPIPVFHDDIARYVVAKFVYSAAESYTNPNIEFFLDCGSPEEALKQRLTDLMPSNSIVKDLWDWEPHLKDESFYDIESAAFCSEEEISTYAESLADETIRWIDEYEIDFNQDKWESPEAFALFVREECSKFMRQWRDNVRDEFGR